MEFRVSAERHGSLLQPREFVLIARTIVKVDKCRIDRRIFGVPFYAVIIRGRDTCRKNRSNPKMKANYERRASSPDWKMFFFFFSFHPREEFFSFLFFLFFFFPSLAILDHRSCTMMLQNVVYDISRARKSSV